MHSHNTLTPWHPWLRPIARLLIGALLCHALLPLSALAQHGAAPISPTDQAQIQRLARRQRTEQAKIPRARAAHPMGSRVSERTSRNLSRVHELLKGIKARTERAPAGMKNLGSTMAAKTAKAAPTTGQADPAELEQIGALLGAIDADTDTVLADFAAQ